MRFRNNAVKSGTGAREYKAVSFELERVDESTGEFSGYASIFGNVDQGGDIVEKGAFAKTIVEDFDRIKIFFQHDDSELPIGRPLELREDDKGLYIRGKISSTQKGRDIQTLMKDGVLNELSIGYDAVLYDIDEATQVRHLKQVKLWEVSIVTWAMNDQATIEDVKSLAEELKVEARSGKMSRARLNALKPFIAVVRELVEILGPFLEPSEPVQAREPPEPEDDPPELEAPPSKKQKKSAAAGMIFEIVPHMKT